MKHCGECGSSSLSVRNIKGTFHSWKDFARVEILLDQEALVCGNCGNQILKSKDLELLDQNIAQSILLKINNAISYLSSKYQVSQEDIATALGRTPEYLSMIKNGKKRPSFGTFNLLMAFQKHPKMLTELAGVEIKEPIHSFIGPSWQITHITRRVELSNKTKFLIYSYADSCGRMIVEESSTERPCSKEETGIYPLYISPSRQ